MNGWKRAWRSGIAPLLTHDGLMALKAALEAESAPQKAEPASSSSTITTLHDALANAGKTVGKIKIIPLATNS